jgi:hypothetical protein
MHEPNRSNDNSRSTRKGAGLGWVLKAVGVAFLLVGFASCVLAMSQYG